MALNILYISKRNFSVSASKNFKVALVGASGGIGQPLALLLKMQKVIKHLVLHDIAHTPGVAADISHINTKTQVSHFQGNKQLVDTFKGTHVAVVSAGLPRKPGMTRDDLFKSNANVAVEVAKAAAKVNPDLFILFITNPVNAVVPVACGVYQKLKKGNQKHVFGVTTLDLVRASTFVAQIKKLDPQKVKIPCVGGHAGATIVPLLSQCKPKVSLGNDEIIKLTKRIQVAGTEVVKAKAGKGSATLSMAFAALRATKKLLYGLKGKPKQIEPLYCQSNVTKSKYFSAPMVFGKSGVQKHLGIPKGISSFEKKQIDGAIKILAKSIKKGEEYGKN